MQYSIPLSRDAEPYHRQIYAALRQGIVSGTFAAKTRLPSTRDLAEQLGVSRSVVLEAYDQLLAEGFVEGRGGSGTYVAQSFIHDRRDSLRRSANIRLSKFGSAAAEAGEVLDDVERSARFRYDFKFGRSESDIETFPFESWQRILTRRIRKTSVSELDYGPAAGNLSLREAIASHLRRSRAVICDASEVIIVSGSQQALDLISRVLIERGDSVAIENPSYQGTRQILNAAGAKVIPVAVDGDGIQPAKLPPQAKLCFVTPSHQFPTGAILPLPRRLAVLEWARRNNAVIVEDDYDGEFRYEGQPLESLQGLDSDGRIIYVGTFSRTIFPSLRVGYLIVPKTLIAAFRGAKWLNDQHSATLEQKALAEFIHSGAYERYLRKVRRRNSNRREALLTSSDKYLGDRIRLSGEGAGAHVALWPKRQIGEEQLIAAAASRGVGVYGISRYYLTKAPPTGFLLGYSRMKEAEIREGIRRLGEIL